MNLFLNDLILIFRSCISFQIYKQGSFLAPGVPVVAQWLTNLTRSHEVMGLIPGLAQWVKDPALPCELWCRLQTQLGSHVALAVV